jgi:F-type H+-transporting ATPase subunit gamma
MTSDRGLAGAYNSNILRLLLKEMKQNTADDVATKVVAIGKKGAQAIAKYDDVELVAVYEDWPIEPSATQISPLFRELTRMFVETEADQVQLIYTDFRSALVQEDLIQQLLPSSLEDSIENVEVGRNINDAMFEPSADAVVAKIVPWLVEIQLLQAALEASASEQSMRRMAMKSATDNATDLIDDLTLEFNSARQAAITQELAEISGGVAALS